MPCQSDYLAPSGVELESKRVCQNLIYLYGKLKKEIPAWVAEAAENYYGNIVRVDEATTLLCAACRNLAASEKELYIYDAHNPSARELAAWFDRHQEWDKRRVFEEEESRKKIIAKDRALKKLTLEEREALGL